MNRCLAPTCAGRRAESRAYARVTQSSIGHTERVTGAAATAKRLSLCRELQLLTTEEACEHQAPRASAPVYCGQPRASVMLRPMCWLSSAPDRHPSPQPTFSTILRCFNCECCSNPEPTSLPRSPTATRPDQPRPSSSGRHRGRTGCSTSAPRAACCSSTKRAVSKWAR